MVYKCCVVDRRSNYAGKEWTAFSFFPKEESLRKIWVKFVNRKDWNTVVIYPRKGITGKVKMTSVIV